MSRRGWWLAVRGLLRMGGIGGCALGVACSNFPAIEGGQCGNAVIDATEDCDTFPVLGHACRAPGAPGACRLDCSQQSDGTRNNCPPGLGCSPNGVCQRATGEYELASSFEAGAVASMSSGDFDGDGRAEVLSREAPDALLRSVFRLHYFDENARLVETQAFSKLAAAPELRDLDRDGSDDLLFSDLRIGLMRGRADRRFVPETFSTYRLPQSQLQGVGVHFSAAAGTPLSTPTGAPFTSFALLDRERSELLFTTSTGLYSARTDETGRGFEASVQLQSLDAGEAVTVADVNGDGIADLVVADARGMTVLRAALAP